MRSFETPETRLAKPLFGMSVFGAISRFAASSRPMLVRPVVSATNGIDGSDSYLRALEHFIPNAGHNLPQENPAALAAAVREIASRFAK